MTAGNASVLYDAQGNPVTGYAATALGTTQPAVLYAGSDYGTTAKAQIPKVDQYGSQYTVSTNPAGLSATVAGGSTPGAVSAQYGMPLMMRMDLPAPSTWQSSTSDPIGALNVHAKSKATMRVIAPGITTGTGKVLLAFTYASTGTMVLRISEVGIYVPQSGINGALLSSSSATYYAVICQLNRITTASGGTAITPAMTDSNDTQTAGISVQTSPTTVSSTVSIFHRQDAYISTASGIVWYGRSDANSKAFVMRPGEGAAIQCMSSGLINGSVAGSGTTQAVVDIYMVVTQAPA